MAPNLETIKNISNRFTRFRHHRNHETADDNPYSKMSSQNPNQPPDGSNNSLSANQAQPKIVSGTYPSATSYYAQSTASSGQGINLSQSSKLPSMAGNKPAAPNATPSFFYPGHSNAFATAKPAFGDSYVSSSSNDQKDGLGSRFNPIDLTDPPTTYSKYDDHFMTGDFPHTANGPMSNKTIPPTSSWYSQFPADPPPPPPPHPKNSSTQNKYFPGGPLEFMDHGMGQVPLSDFPSAMNHWPSPMLHQWLGPTQASGSYYQAPGHVVGQGTSTDKTPVPNASMKWGWVGHGMSFPMITPELPEELEADMMVIDAESPGNSSESSTDLERAPAPEDVAAVNLALDELEPLRDFVRGCLAQTCPKCTKNTKKPKSVEPRDIIKMTTGWAKGGVNVPLGVSCQNVFCSASTCLGCGKAISPAVKDGFSAEVSISGTKVTVIWCCDVGRLAAIWALACGWEAPSWKSRTVTRVVSKVRQQTNAKPTIMHGVVEPSHPLANAKGVGYGGGRPDYFPFPYLPYMRSRSQHRPTPKKPVDIQECLLREAYFRLLAVLLPSPVLASPIDASPPPFLAHMLSRSPLIERAAALLGSDSIDEVARQYQVHDAVLDLFDALGSHSATAGLVYNDRTLYHPKGGSLLEVSVGPMKNKGRIIAKDTSKPMLSLLQKLAAQSLTVLRHANASHDEFQSGEGINLLNISQRISQLSHRHEANMQLVRTTMDISEVNPDVNFAQWHRENCVIEVEDEIVMRDFAAQNSRHAQAHAFPTRGRMKRLITEISTLKTSLPEGIFICHGSSRLDIMKVLIIGPKNTPYEHGMFEFDLCCPLDYPNSPPLMRFRTTNGGTIRFNPNLYEDGKICLSLLGTWAGEPWRADQSTILQVLVSIQSMILCEQPWYNEPGREQTENKSLSVKYNNDVRAWTLKFALLPWINAVGAKDTVQNDDASSKGTSVWQETAQLYLRSNAKEILRSSKLASSKSKKSAAHNIAATVDAALRTQGYLD
ncbi:hypothetical protein F5B19DRAFT_494076 [Rostrohypoxylon terebratum]|nr:hypothetical protein F5B19DRAFT_494076 [Rostrohypoxylon terebratum]